MTLGKSVFRLLSIIGKEVVETVRRPGAALSLIIGPFLILALFGFGYDSVRDPFRAVVVIPPESGLPSDPTDWDGIDSGGARITEVVESEASGRAALDAGRADLVVIAPLDA